MIKPLGQNQSVILITAEGKEVKGVITEVIAQLPGGGGSARIDFTPRNKDGEAVDPEKEPLGHHTAVADYSDEKKPLTFHFPPEPKAPAPKPETNHAGGGARG